MNRTLKKNILYSITISPSYRLSDPLFLYNKDIPLIIRWFRKFSKHFILFTEICESSSRIHYHGTISIFDIIKFHRTRYNIQKNIGFIKLKRLNTTLDLLRWTYYIRKDYHSNYKLFPFIMHLNKPKRITPKVKHSNSLTINIIHLYEYINIKEKEHQKTLRRQNKKLIFD